MAYTYRKITPETISPAQFDQIVEIESHCGMEPYTPDMLADCIQTLDTFACFDGDTIVGFLTANPHSRYFGGSLYIVNLNVAPAYRGRGIATRLIYQLTEEYRHIFVTLDVMKTNPAMKLYQRLGFHFSDLPSRNGDTDVVMYALLSQLKKTIPPLLSPEARP